MLSAQWLVFGRLLLQLLALAYALLVVQIMFVRLLRHGRRFFSFVHRPANHPLLRDKHLGFHQYVKLNDITLHYVDNRRRNRPVVIFLHGFLQFWRSWKHQLTALGDKHRTVAVDLRGYGLSEQPNTLDAYRLERVVEDIRCLIEHLQAESGGGSGGGSSGGGGAGANAGGGHARAGRNGTKPKHPKVILVGYDLGGLVGWMLAARHPKLVDRLVVISAPHPKAFTVVVKRRLSVFLKSWFLIFAQIPLLPELYLLSNDLGCLRKLYSRVAGDAACVLDADELECCKSVFGQPNAISHALSYYRANIFSRLPDAPKPVGVLAVPLLLLWGANDPHFSQHLVDESLRLAKQATFHLVPDADRFAHMDRPNAVNTCIAQFVKDAAYY